MTIHRNHRLVTIECDSCDATHTIESEDFADTWKSAKDEGWRTRKIMNAATKKEEWVHGCPKCGV